MKDPQNNNIKKLFFSEFVYLNLCMGPLPTVYWLYRTIPGEFGFIVKLQVPVQVRSSPVQSSQVQSGPVRSSQVQVRSRSGPVRSSPVQVQSGPDLFLLINIVKLRLSLAFSSSSLASFPNPKPNLKGYISVLWSLTLLSYDLLSIISSEPKIRPQINNFTEL